MINSFTETLFDSYGQTFTVDKVYYHQQTQHQDLIIFHNAKFGRVMALDGVVQTTSADEFIYHEMLTHVPLLAHGNAARVLIIGGGDGGILREVLKHTTVDAVTQVEIDQDVIDLCREYFPHHSEGAFDNPRATIIIDDGFQFIRNTKETFDLIITDSTDPIGPGKVLFSHEYYAACRRCLTPNGILVTQNGVPFYQMSEVQNTAKAFENLFADWQFYTAAIPTYVGGVMAFGFASQNPSYRQRSIETIKERYTKAALHTRYYNPGIHIGSFYLPQYIVDAIVQQTC